MNKQKLHQVLHILDDVLMTLNGDDASDILGHTSNEYLVKQITDAFDLLRAEEHELRYKEAGITIPVIIHKLNFLEVEK